MAQLPCFKGSWAIYPSCFFDIDGATQDSEPSTFKSEYINGNMDPINIPHSC